MSRCGVCVLRCVQLFVLLLIVCAGTSRAQTTSFTYQGRLQVSGSPANGSYDFQFTLWDSLIGGTQEPQPSPVTVTNTSVAVSGGVFTVQLDFGVSAFPGANRFLEISVRPSGGGGFTTLSPRQQITPTPYAIDATTLGGFPASGFLQNGTSTQATANFNISGDGTAGGTLSGNVVNTATQYNIGGSSALSVTGVGAFINTNTFTGIGAGTANTPDVSGAGSRNSFYGFDAGGQNTTGNFNSFFGELAGGTNTTGNFNSFFGAGAGASSTTSNSSCFGYLAGGNNVIGGNNSFFGYKAGFNNAGGNNSFFGYQAGLNNTGVNNSFFGESAGNANTTGQGNSFFGESAGNANTMGTNNSFFGELAGTSNLTGGSNSFFGVGAGFSNTTGGSNSFVGNNAGLNNTTGGSNTFIGNSAGNLNTSTQVSNSTAIGFGATVSTSHTIVLGTSAETTQIPGTLSVSGLATLTTLGAAGATTLCRNVSNQISTCSSSLRYKTNLAPYSSGLDVINRLRPITFDWKQGGMHDLGFGAEDVAKVDPLLVTYNDEGQVEGVKYDRISTVLVNAIKQQQDQIETLRAQNAALSARLHTVESALRKKSSRARRR